MCSTQRYQQERGVPARQADRPASDASSVERRLRRRRVATARRLLGVDVPRWSSLGGLGATRQRRRARRLQRRPGEHSASNVRQAFELPLHRVDIAARQRRLIVITSVAWTSMCVYIERYLVAYIYKTGYHVFGDFVWWKA